MFRAPLLLATGAMLVGGVLLTGQIMAKDGPLPSTPDPITLTPTSHQHPGRPASPPGTSQCATDESGHDDHGGPSVGTTHHSCDSYAMESVGPTPQWLSDDHSGHGIDHGNGGDRGHGGGRR
jgi:hypothetical protein